MSEAGGGVSEIIQNNDRSHESVESAAIGAYEEENDVFSDIMTWFHKTTGTMLARNQHWNSFGRKVICKTKT